MYQKNSLLAPSGAEILGGGGGIRPPPVPHTTAKGLIWKGLTVIDDFGEGVSNPLSKSSKSAEFERK